MKTYKQNFCLISLLIVMIAVSGCSFEEPVLPSWFTNWRAPIPNPGFVMEEAINDSTIIDTTFEGQSTIAISIIDSSERQQISRSDLAFLPNGDQAEQGIGDISLLSPGTEETPPIPVSDFFLITVTPGVTIDIPASTVSIPSIFMNFGTFEFIVNVKEGTIQIEFINDSYLDFSESTKISIYDSSTSDFVGDAVFTNPILARTQQVSQPVELTGKEFSNHLRFEMELDIMAKSGYVVQPEDTAAVIIFKTTISEMKVGRALAQIPEQKFFRKDSTSTANQEDRMISAHIDAGAFLLEIENTLNVSADVNVQLLNFYTDPDYTEVLSLDYQLQALQKDTFTVYIDDLYVTKYLGMPAPGTFINYMKYQFFVTTLPSDEMVEMSEKDSVILIINPVDSVYLREFEGDLAPREVDFDPIEENDVIDTEGFEGSLRFEEISMTLNIYNQIGLEILTDLDIQGYKNNKTESIELVFNDNPIQVGAREPDAEYHVETVILNKDNSNLVEFLEFLPQDIVITGTSTIEGVGVVSVKDEVWSDYHIFSPFYLKLQDDALYSSDIEGASIDEGTQDAIKRGDVDNFFINLGLLNGLPVGAQMKIYVSADRENLFEETITDSSRKIIIDDIQFLAGELNSDKFVIENYEDDYQIGLTSDQLYIFANDSVFIASKIFLDDTEGLVKFRSTDEIRANGAINIRYRMNNED